MQVGGVPAQLIECRTRDELLQAAFATWQTGEDWLVLGGGSNIVVADEVPDLHVIRVLTEGIEVVAETADSVSIRVQAGHNWDALVAHAVACGWAGLEALSGIPGTVGAAPVQNIGAYGQEVATVIDCVEFLDYARYEVEILPARELGFGYRDSVFKQGRVGVITWVQFRLAKLGGFSQPVQFDQLATALGVQLGQAVELPQVRAQVLRLRATKGMVLDTTDRDTFSCGSFFTNPVVSARSARGIDAGCPRWESAHNDGQTVKLSAAWLIQHSGFGLGYRIPGSNAGLSSKHTLAITNRGGASATEVVELAALIQQRVANTFGINLIPEPNLIGF